MLTQYCFCVYGISKYHFSWIKFKFFVSGLTLLALISVVVFIAAYSIGIGPIAWLLIGEIIPVRARGNSAGLATGFNLFMVFILTLQFSNMMVSLIIVMQENML